MREEALRFEATASRGEVSARLLLPDEAVLLYVLAHGAGAGMHHPFLEAISQRLAARGVATMRFQFPSMEAGSRRPDPPAIARKTVRSAVCRAREIGLPLVAGGRSFGGRMTAYAEADEPLGVRGLAFLGFPLHPSGRPGRDRWEPMHDLHSPTLFVQGDRDRLADLTLLQPLVAGLEPPGRVHVIEGGDHSFNVLKRSGRSPDEVLDEISDTFSSWARSLEGSTE